MFAFIFNDFWFVCWENKIFTLTEEQPLRIYGGKVEVLNPYPGFGGDRQECIAVLVGTVW